MVTKALLVISTDSVEIHEGSDEMCLKEGLKEDIAAIMRRLEDLAAKVESCGRSQNGKCKWSPIHYHTQRFRKIIKLERRRNNLFAIYTSLLLTNIKTNL